jgi:hypothetical protein
MKKQHLLVALSSLLILLLLAGCSGGLFAAPTPTPTNTPVPTSTPLPTATPTATPLPYYVTATVISGDIQAPILLYHRWANDSRENDSTHVTYSTFKAQLQKLYDAGFSLVSLSSWLDGTFTVPAGRKPLVFTVDDGWFSDQLYINDDGTPSEYSGLGLLYQFSKDHPDFGFAASINVNMGDKDYGDLRAGDWFFVSAGDAWKTKLANTMVWAIENNIEIFNHTYTHADLSITDPQNIEYQLKMNDQTERNFLALVNRSDLDTKLGNVIALPFGNWPSTPSGMDVLKNYLNPEGKPVSAIEEAYNADEAVLTPSVFSANFDRMNLQRITATDYSINWVVSKKDEVPTVQKCQLGPTSAAQANDPSNLQALISSAVQNQTCPEGIYHANGLIFMAKNGIVTQYSAATGSMPPAISTPGK